VPKVSAIQNAFNSGEITTLLYGRTDFDSYKNALKVCLNNIPLIQGATTRRPGTYFCDEVADSSKFTRLIPFKYSTTQAYMLEFGEGYIRFKRDNAPVTETPQAITAITKANPMVVTYSGADYSAGMHVDIQGVVGMTEVNNRRYEVVSVDTGANTMILEDMAGAQIDSTNFTAYSSDGTVAEVVEIAAPYQEDELARIKYVQSADVLYLVHPVYAPRRLTRSSHTTWTLTTMTNTPSADGFVDGPYLPVNSTATTLTPSATTGTGITLTASSIVGINNGTGFQASDIGRYIRIKEGTDWAYVEITGRTSTTVVTVTAWESLVNTNAKASWRLGLYSETTGYPAAVTFYEDRLIFGGCPANPPRFDGSRTGDYHVFRPTDYDGTVVDDHAVSFVLNSDDVQTIRWMKGDEKALVVGTVEGEWPVRPSVNSEAMSPTNVSAKQSTGRGSADIQGIRAGDAILFVQTAKRQLRELAYVFEADKFKTPDMTVLSEHITKAATPETSGITDLTYQKMPQSIVWATRGDGALLSFTYERDQKVLAWARHELGGYSDSANVTHAKVESVACIPSADGTRDELWMIVQRYINGRLVRYVEYLTKTWEHGDVQEDAIYGDCALTYDGIPALTITGLYHLAGQTVGVLADGAAHPDCVVSATGTITLDAAASVVQVGQRYNSDGQLLRLDVGAADGTAQGKLQRSHRVIVRVHDTLGLKTGANFNTSGRGKLTEYTFRTGANLTDTAVDLQSKDCDVAWDGDYTTENYVCWRFDGMFPGTILAIMPQMHTQDR
jgi:hypothetical protein